MGHYIDDLYEYITDAADAWAVVEDYNKWANWLAEEELDLD